ncbi:MAG TPA: phage/plasmid primase, P4 family [Methanosarcina sp.]
MSSVNEMTITGAAKFYTSIGIITHPLYGPDAEVKSPGKQPVLSGWQKKELPFSDAEIDKKFSDGRNIGFICGKRSDLTVIDIDWYVKGIWENILRGVDTGGWIEQRHSPQKWHYLFKHSNGIDAKTYQVLGFDVLSDTTKTDVGGNAYVAGNNCVASPSLHPDGSKYKIIGNVEERPVIPEIVINRINNVIRVHTEITGQILPKCRRAFQGLWDAVFINKDHELYHKTSIFMGDKENRDRHLHLCAELKANGATDLHLNLICMLIFGDRYDPVMTEKELQHVQKLPAKKETILVDQYLSQFFTEHDRKNGKSKTEKGKPEKIQVYFDEVAEQLLKDKKIFTMRDTKEVYLYTSGVYHSDGAEAFLDTYARIIQQRIFADKWKEVNPEFDFPEHIPKATTRFVNEVLAYIRAYTHIPREVIDYAHDKYINFKNCLFNLQTWKIEEHTPEIKTICQIPVNYDPDAECTQITKFIRDVAKKNDINFLEEWAGYCLTTDVRYQRALMVYGIPGTGKSVFLALIEALVGDKNCSVEGLQKIEEDKYRAAKLYGKRVNICSDIPSTRMHKTEVFKKLVSGLDTIDAENKFQDPFKFKNKAKLTFSANKIPEGPKDPAFYERFCLVEFEHKFRGTEDDDKNLIRKLTTDIELSGFLNVALKGLKRLYDNDKFSYNKTFEETEREYMLNSNPVAFFMEECTMISSKDIEGTLLYLSYVDWCNKGNKTRVSNIEFSRQLNKMGYTSHRDNVMKDGSKKVTVWDNLQLKLSEKNDNPHEPEEKKCDSGQDRGQDQLDRSCPKKSSQLITESLTKNAFGQDPFPYVDLEQDISNIHSIAQYENIEEAQSAKTEKNEISTNKSKRSCPRVCFFDSGSTGQDVLNHPVQDPVRKQKTLVFEQNEDKNSMKILSGCDLMRTDLKNFARSQYHLTVDNIPVFVGEFNKEFPGYKQTYGLQAILDNVERLSSRGWR